MTAHATRPRTVSDAVRVAVQIARALEAAHKRGIIHRDLKPANIKVTDEGVVKVLDFGLGEDLGDDRFGRPCRYLTGDGTRVGEIILGTPAYMSPEQARGQTVDTRTDIWAFGCVLFEMLTGRRRVRGQTASDTIAKVLEREPRLDGLAARDTSATDDPTEALS